MLLLSGNFTAEEWTVLAEMLYTQVPQERRLALLLDLLKDMDVTDNVIFLMKKVGVWTFLSAFVALSVLLASTMFIILQFFLAKMRSTSCTRGRYIELDTITRPSPAHSMVSIPLPHSASPPYDNESVKAGSKLLSPKLAKCQVRITFPDGSPCASGFRYRSDLLITAKHAVNEPGKYHIIGSSGYRHVLDSDDFTRVQSSDLVCALLPTNVWSALGVANGLSVEKIDDGMSVTVSSSEASSTGVMSSTDYIFHYEYTGSTLPGFSGAPYMQANRVAGMHLGAGTLNIGLSIKAIDMLLDHPDLDIDDMDNFQGESNKRGQKKANRKIADDSYLDYVRATSEKGNKRYEAMYVNGQNDDHGVVIKGIRGRIVYAEEQEDWMDISPTPKKKVRSFTGESLSSKTTTLTPQFEDQPPFLEERQAQQKLSLETLTTATAELSQKDKQILLNALMMKTQSSGPRQNATVLDTAQEEPAPSQSGSTFQPPRTQDRVTRKASTRYHAWTPAQKRRVSVRTSRSTPNRT
ncbi:hypothetical protein 1 [Sanxia sobemo-like virus 1]|uniref:hypothetical protein 1 n=1 Tax=Sanxia sobemo-like virus 1 TaxID=1923380 RepID=UPI00090C7B14|nr:hypothetical protein 1 [Sanxia sobemo-like virus 1]APG75865.1 hypothetical protein 1 [Sanxia sobemo-like virus 1]